MIRTELWEVDRGQVSEVAFSDLDFRTRPFPNCFHGRDTTKRQIAICILLRSVIIGIKLTTINKRDATTMTLSRTIESQAENRSNPVLLPYGRKDRIVWNLVIAEVIVGQIGARKREGDIWVCKSQHPARRTIAFPSCGFDNGDLRVDPITDMRCTFPISHLGRG